MPSLYVGNYWPQVLIQILKATMAKYDYGILCECWLSVSNHTNVKGICSQKSMSDIQLILAVFINTNDKII